MPSEAKKSQAAPPQAPGGRQEPEATPHPGPAWGECKGTGRNSSRTITIDSIDLITMIVNGFYESNYNDSSNILETCNISHS